MASSACGLLNREKRTKSEILAVERQVVALREEASGTIEKSLAVGRDSTRKRAVASSIGQVGVCCCLSHIS